MKKLIMLLCVVFLYSCGEDNPTDNGNPPVSNSQLIFTKDSMRVEGFITNGMTIDTVFSFTDSLVATFTLETNIDSSNVTACAFFLLNDTSISFCAPQPELNQSHTFSSPPGDSTYIHVEVNISNTTSTPRYLKIKDVKVYRIF